MTNPILKITDGTTTVNLLDLKGWLLQEWKPSVPDSNRIFRSSPMTNGRKLAYRTMSNVIDTFNLIGQGQNQDMMIASIQKLQTLLEKALSYWTSNWQSEPVWIEAKGAHETDTRYAVISDYRLTGFGNPFQQPFFDCNNSVTEAILVIEHRFWQETVPGEDGECVELASETQYPSVLVGARGAFNPGHSLADETYSSGLARCDTASTLLGVGYVPSTPSLSVKSKCTAGIVFEGVNIPAGSIIKSAVLKLHVTGITTDAEVEISGQSQTGGKITSVTLTSGGCHYGAPYVIVRGEGGTGSGAEIVATVARANVPGCNWGAITELTIVSSGEGYVNPTIIIKDHPGSGDGAFGTCTAGSINVDAALFDGTNADFLNRTRTVSRTVEGFDTTMASNLVTFEITDIVREVTSNSAWTSGDNLALFIDIVESTKPGAPNYAKFYSYDEMGINIPEIFVEWSQYETPVGRETTCAQEVFVANKHNIAPVKYIYCYDANLTRWSPNMFEWNYTNVMPLFQDDTGVAIAPAAGDCIYFGSCPSGAGDFDYGPFNNLVFDIETKQAGITDYVWEYYDGAWTEFDLDDSAPYVMCGNNLGFDSTGVCSLVFQQPGGWTQVDPGIGKTGYWIRFRVVAAAGAATPKQWHRDIYTVLNPYIDIDGDRVFGDIPALAKINFDSAACWINTRSANTIVIGLRSLSRGEQFDAYLNVSDVQNSSGIRFHIEDTYLTSDMTNNPETPTGRKLPLNNFDPYNHSADHIFMPICSWGTSGDLANQYIGVYHAYIRGYFPTQASGHIRLRLRSVFGDEVNVCYSEIGTPVINDVACIDMGQFTIMPLNIMKGSDFIGNMKIYLDGQGLDDDFDYWHGAYVMDVVLIPADEWSGNFGLHSNAMLTYRYGAEIDGITNPRQYRAVEVNKPDVTNPGFKQIVGEFSRIASSEPILQANADQRLWFMQYLYDESKTSAIENCGAVSVQRSSRYLLMRGNS